MKYLQGIPETLYKYRVWDNKFHKRLITENEVFLASPASLNDPFDASLPFRYDPSVMTKENIFIKLLQQGRLIWPNASEEELHQLAYTEQQSGKFEDDTYWKDQHENAKAELHKTFGLLSLTTHPDNLLMWAHYANCHRGFCVGISSKILYDVVGGSIGPVNYIEDFPLMPLFPEEGQDVIHMVKMLNSKSPHWRYEDEFRLTRSQAANMAFTLPTEAITEVILGCNMSTSDRAEIIGVVDSKLPSAKIFESVTSLEKFRLNINSANLIKAQ